MTLARDSRITAYVKIGTLLAFLLVIDLSSIIMLFDKKVIEGKENLDTYSILKFVTALEICSMLMYLVFYIITCITNILEIVKHYELENKNIVYKATKLIFSFDPLGIRCLGLSIISDKTNVIPIFVIASIVSSLVEIIVNICSLFTAIVRLKKLNSILEVTKEEMKHNCIDDTCTVCQMHMNKGVMLE